MDDEDEEEDETAIVAVKEEMHISWPETQLTIVELVIVDQHSVDEEEEGLMAENEDEDPTERKTIEEEQDKEDESLAVEEKVEMIKEKCEEDEALQV